MATHDDGESINFNKLEKELMQAVEADARYWRENDAKIRAVTNKVASYEEFKWELINNTCFWNSPEKLSMESSKVVTYHDNLSTDRL